eukprot:TRINITY_DN20883_c0_g1_i1.p2 TRINITY_DN20883_c0_g1~~TRINITY_DN20883_c0_g1_i1.p2  ORF type:complete len:153 (-),score=0.94 TRINITY_DN20883_c0_g1_i1:742-1200(-)
MLHPSSQELTLPGHRKEHSWRWSRRASKPVSQATATLLNSVLSCFGERCISRLESMLNSLRTQVQLLRRSGLVRLEGSRWANRVCIDMAMTKSAMCSRGREAASLQYRAVGRIQSCPGNRMPSHGRARNNASAIARAQEDRSTPTVLVTLFR